MSDEAKKTEEVELSVEQLEEATGAGDGSVRVQNQGAAAAPTQGLLLPAVKGGIIAV